MLLEKVERFGRLPMPMGVGLAREMNRTRFVEVLRELQGLIGSGVAGPLEDLPAPKEMPLSYGVLGVLKIFPEDLMHSFASGEVLLSDYTITGIYYYTGFCHIIKSIDEVIS